MHSRAVRPVWLAARQKYDVAGVCYPFVTKYHDQWSQIVRLGVGEILQGDLLARSMQLLEVFVLKKMSPMCRILGYWCVTTSRQGLLRRRSNGASSLSMVTFASFHKVSFSISIISHFPLHVHLEIGTMFALWSHMRGVLEKLTGCSSASVKKYSF